MFSELIAQSQSQVRTFLVRLCRDYDLADDLAQDTFVTAYQKLAGFKGTGSFEAWLFRIAFNRFLQFKRDHKRKQEILSQYAEMLEVDSDRYESASDIQLELEKAMARLNHGEAAAITLCCSFGFSHQETATILDTPLGTVKSQIKRGKAKLQAAMSPTDAESPEKKDQQQQIEQQEQNKQKDRQDRQTTDKQTVAL